MREVNPDIGLVMLSAGREKFGDEVPQLKANGNQLTFVEILFCGDTFVEIDFKTRGSRNRVSSDPQPLNVLKSSPHFF